MPYTILRFAFLFSILDKRRDVIQFVANICWRTALYMFTTILTFMDYTITHQFFLRHGLSLQMLCLREAVMMVMVG